MRYHWATAVCDDTAHQPVVYPIGHPVDIWEAISRAPSSSSASRTLPIAKNIHRPIQR